MSALTNGYLSEIIVVFCRDIKWSLTHLKNQSSTSYDCENPETIVSGCTGAQWRSQFDK